MAANNNVPQIVNRHVLKAVDFLTQECDYAPIWEIKNQVRYTMRNTNPVEKLSLSVMKSLRYLADVGILTRRDNTNCFFATSQKIFANSTGIPNNLQVPSMATPLMVRKIFGHYKVPPVMILKRKAAKPAKM
ncbi:hypothetical protein KR026_004575 [Drosophila bipectinata]|nr:hypothetical protein KR026_004575 [Drosophila bipectinata]